MTDPPPFVGVAAVLVSTAAVIGGACAVGVAVIAVELAVDWWRSRPTR